MQQITRVHWGRDREASRRPGRGGWEGICGGVTGGVGGWKKLYLCERTWIDRRAMRVSTKFRANKSVSEAGERKKTKQNLSENTNRSFFSKLQNELRSLGEEDREG